MRYGAEYWRQKEQISDSKGSLSPVQSKTSTQKGEYHVQSSEDDE